MEPTILIIEECVADPMTYRARALEQPFGDVTIGLATFHGIAPVPTTEVRDRLGAAPGERITTFFRLSPHRQVEPNYIHTDRDMGEWTGILYLNPDPAPGDGTTFWRKRATGEYVSAGAVPMTEGLAWRDIDQWEPWRTVHAAFNRLVLFPSACFHSRALFDSYGDSPTSARLIQVIFGGSDPCQ